MTSAFSTIARSAPPGWERAAAMLARKRARELDKLAEGLEGEIRKRPPGATRPKEKQVGLLDDAIDILSAADPTKDQIPEHRRALGTLDELLDDIRYFDPNAFPEGFARRLANARLGLNIGEPKEALALLKRLRADSRDYWTD